MQAFVFIFYFSSSQIFSGRMINACLREDKTSASTLSSITIHTSKFSRISKKKRLEWQGEGERWKNFFRGGITKLGWRETTRKHTWLPTEPKYWWGDVGGIENFGECHLFSQAKKSGQNFSVGRGKIFPLIFFYSMGGQSANKTGHTPIDFPICSNSSSNEKKKMEQIYWKSQKAKLCGPFISHLIRDDRSYFFIGLQQANKCSHCKWNDFLISTSLLQTKQRRALKNKAWKASFWHGINSLKLNSGILRNAVDIWPINGFFFFKGKMLQG